MSTEVVQSCINDILSVGIDIKGPCGAFKICNLAAHRLGLGILRKPNPTENNCVINGTGYAADIVMSRDGRIWDMLYDGGGENKAVFNEKDPVDAINYREPLIDWPIPFNGNSNVIGNGTDFNPIGLANESNPVWLLQTLHIKIDNIAEEFRNIVLKQENDIAELAIAMHNALLLFNDKLDRPLTGKFALNLVLTPKDKAS